MVTFEVAPTNQIYMICDKKSGSELGGFKGKTMTTVGYTMR